MAKQKKRFYGLDNDPLWYKDAIIYEVHVRAFFDSDGDGVGDFTGLTEKLDYLEDLGVTALWLLPFYPSPLRDDGYDISDYTNILPVYGTMAGFTSFIEEAHRHGIRVITEMVLNHTSDQHPWFQRARKSPKGSNYRNFYVWSDDADKYQEARIIFGDFENSNWYWDPLAREYYWHRFYHHQPDLNYDNPAMRRAMLKIIDFWLNLGVDGLRADAVPYLYERDGTSCENLPETHTFLKELRSHIDAKFKNRMLLAEANQWPEDTAAYIQTADEFHMAFNFPVMPRLFMALRQEDRFPIIDILHQTPNIPESSQWALFLRNHDELTLEMVTDEERDYMYRMYAADPAARINLGIRRRLAPLLGNDRRKIELMKSLLFSLPGTPVMYYGDEIGMGDNFYLGDRNGVRTPMQWGPGRNAGFSQANPQRLYLPPIIDPAYHYESINVENQLNNPDSLLWWMKRIIALRKRYQAFGRGSIEFLNPENRKVLAYLRRYEAENILCVANLSHLAQQTTLDLSAFNGWHPVDLFGNTVFSAISEQGYPFTLSPYSFYWFSLEQEPKIETLQRGLPSEEIQEIPTIPETEDVIFRHNENWFILEAVLLNYCKSRHWFRGKQRNAWGTEIQDIVHIQYGESTAYVVLLEIIYDEGESEIYTVPLCTVPEPAKETAGEIASPGTVVARLKPRGRSSATLLIDAMTDVNFGSFIPQAIKGHRIFKGIYGDISGYPAQLLKSTSLAHTAKMKAMPVKAEETNTSLVYGEEFIFKLFRRAEDGVNPDIEISRFLTEKTDFTHLPPISGFLEYHRRRRKPVSIGMLERFVHHEANGWQYTVDSLKRYFDTVIAHPTVDVPPVPHGSLLTLPKEVPQLAKDTVGAYLASAQLLGQRTAELHLALASNTDVPEFSPEQFTTMYQTSLYQSLRGFAVRTLQQLRDKSQKDDDSTAELVRDVLSREADIIQRYNKLRESKIPAMRIRCHGDYHLAKVLYTGKDFIIIDFEGEVSRSISQRRMKRSPLRDVAGMIRSFHYAAHSILHSILPLQPKPELSLPVLQHWAQYWYTWVSAEFLNTYLDITRQSHLFPEDPEKLKTLLDAFLLDKAVYEVGFELSVGSEWVHVPLLGIRQLLEEDASTP